MTDLTGFERMILLEVDRQDMKMLLEEIRTAYRAFTGQSADETAATVMMMGHLKMRDTQSVALSKAYALFTKALEPILVKRRRLSDSLVITQVITVCSPIASIGASKLGSYVHSSGQRSRIIDATADGTISRWRQGDFEVLESLPAAEYDYLKQFKNQITGDT